MIFFNFFSNLLCSIFAISCLSLPPEIPQLAIENSVILKEVIVVKSIGSNYTDLSLYEEGIVSKTDLNGIVDFEEVVISTTSTDIVLATSTETIDVKPIASFSFVPVADTPKDPAPVDPAGDQFALELATAWITATTSTNVSASTTTTQNNIEIIGNDIVENNKNTTSSLEIIPVTRATATTTLHLVINAISIGTASSTIDEFIKIYNPTSETVSLDGWKLQRVTASGKTENYLVRPFLADAAILSGGYFLVAHPEGYSTTTPGRLLPDAVYTTGSSIASSNTIILFDSDGEIVDMVGYGEATQFEEAPASELNNDGQVLMRTDGADTDNNSVDFKLSAG